MQILICLSISFSFPPEFLTEMKIVESFGLSLIENTTEIFLFSHNRMDALIDKSLGL